MGTIISRFCVAVGYLLALLSVSNAFAAELPRELAKIAQHVPCSSVSNFYDRPGMIDPPYLYGFLPGPKEDSAAFWCESNSKYYLVIMAKFVPNNQRKCPTYFEWWNFPGGLSLSSEKNISLSDFRYAKTPEKKVTGTRFTNYPPLKAYYDGEETLFYCDNGRWLFRIRE